MLTYAFPALLLGFGIGLVGVTMLGPSATARPGVQLAKTTSKGVGA